MERQKPLPLQGIEPRFFDLHRNLKKDKDFSLHEIARTEELRYSSTLSKRLYYMRICGKFRAPVVLPSGTEISVSINPLSPELNPIYYLLALLGAHHFLHISRIGVKLLTFRLLMSYIYGAPILDVSRSHTTTQHSR